MDGKTISLVIFIAAYLLFIFLPRKRTQVALAAAALLVIGGAISPNKPFSPLIGT